ncbi:DNA-formamidopyrimidine glycosylase [candidate division KSB1 bacterium]|nr:DNA-formamidopyrimidine glycosylase [candidate division KSB1 bacterium]NIR70339.1 DNA-formamidopyrimidine glycosylase [candidate division KSB1 bacterium]NIS23109.1 DNA-formamidopyrimidine glycosylase [candidate division KSB1 bacterium]NIT69944.1 DNA-formamidopyrimidine glycosylase [candidate division KSB1 bacterium]NIU23601.1 DNA-formamidopyrimidine glycosylase [candidate division KSB1 bacterium]
MPELPDLVYIENNLRSALNSKRITDIKIKEPIVFRILVSKGFESLIDARFENVYRHGPFLGFKFDNGSEMVIHPMLAGRFKLGSETARSGRGLCFSIHMEDGLALHYADDKKMGKVYLIEAGDYANIPRYTQQGVDILSEKFTLQTFHGLIQGQRKQIRVFLMDQTILSAIGNAYADEILFHARIHPKTFCYQLTQDEVTQLFRSIHEVIYSGIAEVEKARQPIEIKVRDHMKVRNRKDTPCPCCGTTIRRAGVLGYDAYFCPSCQPTSRKQFIDW